MKKTLLSVLICVVLIATGCPKSTPKKPSILTERLITYYVAQYDLDLKEYECAAKGKIFNPTNLSYTNCAAAIDSEKARSIRNDVTHRLIRWIDNNYFEFENDLYVKRSSGSFLADATEVGANLAATITNGERAKTIINAAITAFRGGRKSGSINFFQEQTAEALISSMQSSRNKVLADIIPRLLEQPIDRYSLDESLGDVIKYFYAGTLPRALQELKQNATKIAEETKEEVRVLKGLTPQTPATKIQETNGVAALEGLKRLFDEGTNGASESIKSGALAKLQSIVEQLNNDKALVDEINKTQSLKDILAALNDKTVTKTAADFVRGINKLREMSFEGKTLKPESLEKLNGIIIKAAQK